MDAGWYQGMVKLIACEDERSAALYKAAINKVGEVYPGAKLAVCEAADIPSRPRARVWLPSEPSEPEAILSLLQPEASNRRFEAGQAGEIRSRHHERDNPPEPGLLGTSCSPTKPGELRVQLRIYDTDKLAADNFAACASYEPPSDDELEHELSSELTESLKQLCTQDITRPGRTVLQDIAEEAEGSQPDQGPKDGAVPAD